MPPTGPIVPPGLMAPVMREQSGSGLICFAAQTSSAENCHGRSGIPSIYGLQILCIILFAVIENTTSFDDSLTPVIDRVQPFYRNLFAEDWKSTPIEALLC